MTLSLQPKKLCNVPAVPKEFSILEATELRMLTGEPFHLKIPPKECLKVGWAFPKCSIKVRQLLLTRLMKIKLKIDCKICIIIALKI